MTAILFLWFCIVLPLPHFMLVNLFISGNMWEDAADWSTPVDAQNTQVLSYVCQCYIIPAENITLVL